MNEHLTRRRALRHTMALASLSIVGACGGRVDVGPAAIAGKTPDGTIELRQVQVAYIGSGSTGEGVLRYRGRSYPFDVSGLGVGGIGASTIDAAGDVYNLANIQRFPGSYAQGRYGFALGTTSGGEMWLQNEAGVILRLKARREGLMLSLGGDAVLISMR